MLFWISNDQCCNKYLRVIFKHGTSSEPILKVSQPERSTVYTTYASYHTYVSYHMTKYLFTAKLYLNADWNMHTPAVKSI